MDEIDAAQIINEKHQRQAEARIRGLAAAIPVGEPGKCEECGEQKTRLVGGNCAPCREYLERIANRG